MKIKITKKIQETSIAGAVQGHVDNREELKESEVSSQVLQNDSSGYISYVSFDGTTKANKNYKIAQELSIEKYGDLQKHVHPEVYEAVRECLPNNIIKTSFGETLNTYHIDFQISYIEIDGEPLEFDKYDENIFSKMDSLKFFRHVMKEVGEYIMSNTDKVYYFYGIHGDNKEDDGTTESMRTKLYKMFLKKLYKLLPGDWRNMTLRNVNQFLFWKCPDQDSGEQKELVFESQDLEFTNEELDLIYEMYSSAGIMGMGSGRIPSERNPEAHKRYVRMRFINQGLQNFKSNRYFAEDKKKSKKIRIKIKKNLEEKCQKGYKTHEKRKTKKMFGKTYRNCVKAE